MPHEVIMPALGMAQETGVIVSWRKALGDSVAIGDPLFDVETDKTTMEVEATHAGYLAEIRADAGADVPVGDIIAIIAEVASSDAGVDLGSETVRTAETKPSTPLVVPAVPTAPQPPTPPAPRDKPAAPSTPSAVPTRILASPKVKFEAHRRGIDLRRLVDQGLQQPFHVADLDRLEPELAAAALPAASQLSARFEWCALNDFIAWAEERTGGQDMRQPTLAAFAAAAFRAEARSNEAASLIVSVTSIMGSKSVLRDPDLRGLGEPADFIVDNNDTIADLTVIDLTGTRLVEYRPPARPGCLMIVLTQGADNEAIATLHFCEDDLLLLAAMRFLDSFAMRIAEPATQLL